ncbi:MAG: hypothetical protein HY433_00370 [Candidatus Liptonbacteria bacterium]|nr:hypothetical protein [Candidatus Liptonbacteria bacterium]
MQRIITDKKDTVAKIIEKILESPEAEIVLVIPVGSILSAGGASDFQLLKREAEAADKRISLESVDKETLALAKKVRLEAVHPLFKEEGISRSLSDIVSVRKISDSTSFASAQGGKTSENSFRVESPQPAARYSDDKKKKKNHREEETLPEIEIEKEFEGKKQEETESRREIVEALYGEAKTRKISLRKFKIPGLIAAAVILFVGAAWAIGAAFGRAEVAVSFKKVPWQYQETFLGDKILAKIDANKRSFPVESFSQDKNVTRLFPASGKTEVNQKATGKITVYNAYNASPQLLVANTRFAAPDGKIFRLDNQTLVPGAKVQSGKITPSSVEANVTADKAGEEYNIGPVARLTIPGFKDSPKYDGFYGAFLEQTSGGSTGQKPAPTEQDIASAKDKTAESLKANLENPSLNNRPEGFKILPDASQIQITKLTVNKTVDQSGNFGIFGGASFRALGFREADVKAILQELAAKDYPQMTFKDLKLDYGAVKPDFKNGKLSFSLSVQAALGPQFSGDELKSKIGGLSVNGAKKIILALPSLSGARISLWPFWLRSLPANAKKINIVVE